MRKLTKEEKQFLTVLQKEGFKYIARDWDGIVWVYPQRPIKVEHMKYWGLADGKYQWVDHWFKDLFSWQDEEPTLIDDLLKGDE